MRPPHGDREPRVLREGSPRGRKRAVGNARDPTRGDWDHRVARSPPRCSRLEACAGQRLRGDLFASLGEGRTRHQPARLRSGQHLERRTGDRSANLSSDPNHPRWHRATAHHPGLEHAAPLRGQCLQQLPDRDRFAVGASRSDHLRPRPLQPVLHPGRQARDRCRRGNGLPLLLRSSDVASARQAEHPVPRAGSPRLLPQRPILPCQHGVFRRRRQGRHGSLAHPGRGEAGREHGRREARAQRTRLLRGQPAAQRRLGRRSREHARDPVHPNRPRRPRLRNCTRRQAPVRIEPARRLDFGDRHTDAPRGPHLARRREPRHAPGVPKRDATVGLEPLRCIRVRDRHSDRPAAACDPGRVRPHGLTLFPQPGRYSIGHNGVYR